MTQDEKRIKISKHLGATLWANPTNNGPESMWCFECPSPYDVFSMDKPTEYGLLPDYFNDLNAMHEAEKMIRNQFSLVEEAYWRNLECVKPHPIYASAAQRAEAFGKTLNLW